MGLMGLLHGAENLIGMHPALGQQQPLHPAAPIRQQPIQVHPAQAQQLGNNTPAAHLYAANPMAPSVMHADPSQFGYPADNTGQPLRVGHMSNVHLPVQPMLQQHMVNPGLIPMQGSRGYAAYPQNHTVSPQLQGGRSALGRLVSPQ